jgi:serine/threonine-protein kinase
MAPEQVRGAARVDARADVYSMGAVAFRALAGRLPFEGTNAGTIIALKLDRPAPSLSEVTGDRWPAGVERFLAAALERDPEQRFASAVEALQAWRDVTPATVARRQVPPPTSPRRRASSVVDQATATEVEMIDHWDGAGTQTEVGDGFDASD